MSNRWKMLSAAGNQGQAVTVGQELFTTSGTFVVPAGITSISVVCVGGGGGGAGEDGINNAGAGGGGGGGLSYVNNIAVTPGESLTVTVGSGGSGGAATPTNGQDGGTSSLLRNSTTLCSAGGGSGGLAGSTGGAGGSPIVGTGGTGGAGGDGGGNLAGGAGGGAGGYSGNGGRGTEGNTGTGGTQPTGGGGGGGGSETAGSAGGGGVGVNGEGPSGVTAGNVLTGGTGGSGGVSGQSAAGGAGGIYGGGGGTQEDDTAGAGGDGGQGAVRIIYPGNERFFPSTRTIDEFPSGVLPAGLYGPITTISGENDAWSTVTPDISAYADNNARLVFRYQNGGNFTGDIQLDNIQFGGSTYSFENVTHSFETSDNDNSATYAGVIWTAVLIEADNARGGRWCVNTGGTPSTGTGRTDADDGTFYIYAETSSDAAVPGYNIWLRSPSASLGASPTLSFAEARLGASIGTLEVYIEVL